MNRAVLLDTFAVKTAYRRWAPVYDRTFGHLVTAGRRGAVDLINEGRGRVLEVGVGTGLSLPNYAPHLDITGIDLSPEMLARARERVAAKRLRNISALYEMDAQALTFADSSFDTVAAMYVMSVVPDAARVMRELARVTKPGGSVVVVNHFSQEAGARGWIERRMAPFAEHLGWHPVFDVARVMVCDDLDLETRRLLKPWGLFTLLRFVKSR